MKILLTSTDKIGDLILNFPLFKTLRENFKDAQIDLIVQKYTLDIVKYNKNLNNVYTYNLEFLSFRELKKNAKYIKQNNYDIILVMHPTFKVAYFALSTKIPIRITYGPKLYQFMFTNTIIQNRSKIEKHQAVYNMELLKPLGIKKFNHEIKIEYDPKADKLIENYLNAVGFKNFIIIHPGSGKSALEYPLEKYINLAEEIAKKNIKVFITFSIADKNVINKLFNRKNIFNSNIKLLDMKLDLSSFISLINHSKLLVGNSSGPIHIAAGLGVPVIGIYPPVKVQSPKRWGPYTKNATIFVPKVNCDQKYKCKKQRCKRFPCMEMIKEEKNSGEGI